MSSASTFYVSDFGIMRLPPEAARAYAQTPKRKNGHPDRRFIVSREWKRYEARQNQRACAVYLAGGDARRLEAEPWGSGDAAP